MTTREEALVELYKRGALKGPQHEAVGELIRRGKLTAPEAVRAKADAERTMTTPNSVEAARQFNRQATLGASEAVPAAIFAGSEALRGRAGFGAAYSAARQRQNEVTSQRNNGLNTAAGTTGGALTGLVGGLETRGAQLGTRALSALKVGAGVGAVGGALNADSLANIPRDAGIGFGLGGVLGPATVALGAGVGKLARDVAGPTAQRVGGALSGAISPVIRVLRGQHVDLSPEQAAQGRAVATRYLADKLAKRGVSSDMLRAHPAVVGGKPITAAEAIGPEAVNEVTSLSRRPGSTPLAAHVNLTERHAGMQDRLLDDVHAATGVHPEQARAGVESVIANGRKAADPHFAALRANPAPVMSPELSALSQRPAIKKALGRVAEQLQNAGKDPMAAGIVVDPDTGNAILSHSLDKATEQQPTFDTWEATRQALGDLVDRHPITGKALPTTENHGINTAQGDLTSAMKDAIPGFDKALDVAGDYKRVEGAFDRSKGALFSSKIRPAQFDMMWAGAKTEPEKDAIRHSLAAEVYDRAQNGRLTPRSLKAAPAVQAKLATAFGPDKAKALIQSVEHEASMQAEGARMRPTTLSPTGTITETAREHDEAAGQGVVDALRKHGLAGAALHAATAPLREAIAGARAPGNVAFRNGLGELLLSHPNDLADALDAHAADSAATLRLRPVTPYLVAPEQRLLQGNAR